MTLFERGAPFLSGFYFLMMWPAVFLMVMTAQGGSPVSPELYGPLVHSLPALAWGAMQIVFCGFTALAAAARWRWAFVVGSMAYTGMMVTFSVMTMQGGAQGVVLMAHNVSVAVPIGVASVILAVGGAHRVR